MNFTARLERSGGAVPDRPARRTTTAFTSPRIAKNNRFWETIEKAPSLIKRWPREPLTVVSFGGVGSKALIRWLAPEPKDIHLSRAHSHRRIPPAQVGEDQRLVYLFGDPREAVLSIFHRRIARHDRHGFIATPSLEGRSDFAIRHAANLEADCRPMTEDWNLGDYLSHGLDLFRLEEHFDFWRYADVDYPVLFARYETLPQTAPALARSLGLDRPPFPFQTRAARLDTVSEGVRHGLDLMYGDFAGTLADLPDLFKVQKGELTVLGH